MEQEACAEQHCSLEAYVLQRQQQQQQHCRGPVCMESSRMMRASVAAQTCACSLRVLVSWHNSIAAQLVHMLTITLTYLEHCNKHARAWDTSCC
jgi:hypothetical protein